MIWTRIFCGYLYPSKTFLLPELSPAYPAEGLSTSLYLSDASRQLD